MTPTRAPRPRVRALRSALVGAVTLVLLTVLVSACSDGRSGGEGALVIGTAPGAAPGIAADIYAQVLRDNGAAVSTDVVTGSYRDLLDGMDTGSVDLFPAFSGSLLSQLAPGATVTSTAAVYDALNRALPQGVSVGDSTAVVDQLQVVAAASLATTAGVGDLAECARLPAGLPVVSDRTPDPGTLSALGAVGCRLGPFRRLDSVAAVTAEVASGRAVGLVSTLSTAGTDTALTVLADRKQDTDDQDPAAPISTDPADQPAIRAQNLLPVYSSAALGRDQIKAINTVAGELTTADLATMADAVSTGRSSHQVVVANWLTEHSL